ncbi:hypothetical protein [Phenylobacterium sp.]|uniref:hypothetical protein n=1 Tax=Phenylobacterium sp. TaxID=1871053 RepID=UPI0025F15372|nr:hypothetical protein [Phenylobacterium sp.]MBX3482933.1 hypothetical protein [Phenylobacterium sp.]MCW5761341.1 hypothetical protein [Phenylobacterium sp.]
MPRPVLQVVATAIVAACLGAFALGVFTAPSRSRLPGDGPAGKSAEVLQATEAQPLIDERIQGAATPDELTPEEQAALDAEKKARAEAAALAKAEAEKGAPAGPESAPVLTPVPPPAEAAQPAPPPPPKAEEPPF